MDCTAIFHKAAKAAPKLILEDENRINNILESVSVALVEESSFILAENGKDLRLMKKSDPRYDRLLLTPERIRGMASDMINVKNLASPVGRILSSRIRSDGFKISKISVPFGVIAVIYEARPNVTADVFSLCLKSRNACILKGGTDAFSSNKAIVSIISKVLNVSDFDSSILNLLPAGRIETDQLLNARDYVDLIIPRGGRNLIDFVRNNSAVPVIETGAGICHTYFDEFGDREKGRIVINNAKTRRVSVCNALDCLIISEKRLGDLPYLVGLCVRKNVIIYADSKAYAHLTGKYPQKLLRHARRDSYGTEFLSYKMAVKTAGSFEEALDHIAEFGSKHSEAIITGDAERKRLFFSLVDASSVYSNTSTAFTDGGEFGLGAEIGISTQKLHARGPMALEELTTYKWIIEGNAHIRK
jgi:glutamate-5-semialdehyde dehydrogenase